MQVCIPQVAREAAFELPSAISALLLYPYSCQKTSRPGDFSSKKRTANKICEGETTLKYVTTTEENTVTFIHFRDIDPNFAF